LKPKLLSEEKYVGRRILKEDTFSDFPYDDQLLTFKFSASGSFSVCLREFEKEELRLSFVSHEPKWVWTGLGHYFHARESTRIVKVRGNQVQYQNLYIFQACQIFFPQVFFVQIFYSIYSGDK
jgi:hypothetical protein